MLAGFKNPIWDCLTLLLRRAIKSFESCLMNSTTKLTHHHAGSLTGVGSRGGGACCGSLVGGIGSLRGITVYRLIGLPISILILRVSSLIQQTCKKTSEAEHGG